MPDLRPTVRTSVSARDYQDIRELSVSIAAPLSDADATLQSMEDASPIKWHLAHTSWFFEEFVLCRLNEQYQRFDDDFAYLFNSYYETVGARHARPARGMLSRPSLDKILAYREHVDAAMDHLLAQMSVPSDLVVLGLNHEQQHQELMLTDILHAFSQNPLMPAYRAPEPLEVDDAALVDGWTSFDGGVVDIGASKDGFSFDCETPRHQAIVTPFRLMNRAVTNGDWLQFIEDGGYQSPLLWLSDGWATREREGWQAPLYWRHYAEEGWQHFTLRGLQTVDPNAPVSHISQYEADAFATWAGHRLPTEQEWEVAGRTSPVDPHRMLTGRLRPLPQTATENQMTGLFGDVWEWTASAFLPYPGYKPAAGAIGEYNGKFMSGQMVLKGGSCATPPGHIRPSYRNFFPPDKRWQFSGMRLAAND